jgi:SAM-dependent methyltransferase
LGFFSIATDVILQEHKFRPITGRVLMIGRQNTGLTPGEAKHTIERNGVPLLRDDFEIDATAIHTTRRGEEVTDRAFFAAFSNCTVEAVDISPYEGAEIVHDMSVPLPEHLKGQFDFIYDGSSLDNIFNPAATIQNISDLLKPHGRCVLMNWSNSHPTAYAMLSPDWFMDFFAYHEYEDARTLVAEVDAESGRHWRYNPLIYHHDQYGYQCSSITSHDMRATICFAEKSNRPDKSGYPVQVHYRGKNVEPYLSSAIRFQRSTRPEYDLSWHGIKTSRPNISSFSTLTLLADSDKTYDARAAEQAAEALRPINRLKSSIAERRVITGIKRRLSLPFTPPKKP